MTNNSCSSVMKAELTTIQYISTNEDLEFKMHLTESIALLLDFSKRENLGVKSVDSFVTKVVLYKTKTDFDKMLSASPGWPKNTLVPKTYVGVGEAKTFHVVSWDAYKEIHPSDSIDDYKKLLVHELAHLLHIAVLDGKEDEMGPTWFFEGFACYAAGQYPAANLPQKEELRQIFKESNRGNYQKYSAIFHLLSKRISTKELLTKARTPDGIESIEQLVLDDSRER